MGGNTPNKLIARVFNDNVNMFNHLVEHSEFLKAEIELDKMFLCPSYTSDPHFNNTLVALSQRVRDRKFTEAKALEIERNIKEEMRLEVDAQNKKSIEQLGLFSAVITFIVTAAASSFNSYKALTPVILISIGLILVVLITTISICNNPPKQSLLKDKRAWILTCYLIATGVITFVELTRPSVQEIIATNVNNGIEQNQMDYRVKIEELVTQEVKRQTAQLGQNSPDEILSTIKKIVTKNVNELSNKEQKALVENTKVDEPSE